MGDMKTPDFDDLLAAFDIPDIDAKEAIQSSPEDERDEARTNAHGRESGSPSSFTGPPAPQSEPPVVSVIVKNTVRSESFEEEAKSVRDKTNNPSSSALASPVRVKLDDLTSELCPRLPTEAAVEAETTSGFEESPSSQQRQSSTEAWPQVSPLKSTLSENEGESDKGPEPGSSQHASDVMNSLRPLLHPKSPTTGVSTPPSPSFPASVSDHFSPHSPQQDGTCLQDNTLSPPLLQNDSMKTGIKQVMHTDDDDSESELVIQESPESIMSHPPKFKHRAKLPSALLGSPETTASLVPPELPFSTKPQYEEDGLPTTPTSPASAHQTQSPQDCLPPVSTSSASVQEEKYPEHVIDERESPESPPPSETGLLVQNRSSSPDLGSIPTLAANHEEFHHQEEPMESEDCQEDKPGDGEEMSKKADGDGENLNTEKCDADTEDAASAAETVSSPLRPLKVKIKMPTGSITRTVTGVAPKRSGRASSKGVTGSKPSPQRHSTRSKRELLPETPLTAVEMLQDACAATLEGSSTVREKTTADTSPTTSNLRSLGQKTLNSGMTLPASLPLLPPQTSSRPASIVNSTGAIISKSQTNLVEAFNKILNSKNLLPSYKPNLSSPIPAEWGISLPAQGYRCLECGDSFALEQSLAQHYDRRSLRIEVTCNHCAKRLAFFNKCSLLLHAREHKDRGLIMQCSHLVMKPVPVEQMISQQEPSAAGKGMLFLFLQHCNANSKAPPQTHHAVAKKAETVQYTSNKCPECQAQFCSKEDLSEHFQEIKSAQSTVSLCCCSPPMLLPNSCSAAAHQRIHQNSSPHVCPECGGTAKPTQFKTHLDETCLHFSRRIGYRCSSCLVVFGGLNSVKSHIQQAHCDMFHKCPSCPMAFKSGPSIQNHITAQHPGLTEGHPMLIYKCVMCDTVFTHKPLLHAHFDTHLTNQKVHVFKCPECTKLFSQRNSLLDHFKTHKTSTLKAELPSLPGTASLKLESSDGDEKMRKEREEKVKTERMKTPSGWKCSSCNTCYTDREQYITHMSDRHGKILKKFPCNKCESSFTTTSSLRRHIRDKHKYIFKYKLCVCRFCTEGKKTFSSRAMLERHLQLRHSTETASGDEADSSSEQDSGLGARKRRRGTVKVEQDEESADRISPLKKLQSYASSPSSALARGGTEDGTLQCLQCGACFTSTFSLSRHRFITHKVRHVLTDNQQAPGAHPAPSLGNSRHHEDKSSLNGSAPASPSTQPSTGEGKEEEGALACKVCGKHFEKVTDLNTHFRTHGMAFISARNAGKTT
uniref:Zinc finger protein 687a n=1 Tax=Amphilophus citrinellus TaxID=61819 RepID=A0A3Q0S150_AMPCI